MPPRSAQPVPQARPYVPPPQQRVDQGRGDRRWHQEPAVVVTVIIAAAVVIGFIALLVITLVNGSGGPS
jgi:hypothetical protein